MFHELYMRVFPSQTGNTVGCSNLKEKKKLHLNISQETETPAPCSNFRLLSFAVSEQFSFPLWP